MACSIKDNGTTLNQQGINNLLARFAGNQQAMDSIIYDNLNRMMHEEGEDYSKARDFVMNAFNMSALEIGAAHRREFLRLHRFKGKPDDAATIGALINSDSGNAPSLLGSFWGKVHKLFTSYGAFYDYRGTQEGRDASAASKRVRDYVELHAKKIKENINDLNVFLNKNKKYLNLSDVARLTPILNGKYTGAGKTDYGTLGLQRYVDTGELTQRQVDDMIKELDTVISSFRNHIDDLSTFVAINGKGLLKDKLYDVFMDNLGKYTITFYRVHKDSDYAKNFESEDGLTIRNAQFQQVYERALHDLVSHFKIRVAAMTRGLKILNSNLAKLQKEFAAAVAAGKDTTSIQNRIDQVQSLINSTTNTLNHFNNKVLINNGLNPDMNAEVVNMLIQMHKDANENQDQNVSQGFGASITKGILKKRKPIPQSIKELMGEYKDIRDLYSMSAAKLASMATSAEFQIKLADLNDSLQKRGETPFFSTHIDRDRGLTEQWKVPGSYSVLAASLGVAPNGFLFVTKDMREYLDESQQLEKFYSSVYGDLTSLAKTNLTVRGHRQIIRNFVAWWTRIIPGFVFSRNKAEVATMFLKSLRSRLAEEASRLRNYFNREKSQGFDKKTIYNPKSKERRAFEEVLIEQGLKSSEISMSEINKSYRDQENNKDANWLRRSINRIDSILTGADGNRNIAQEFPNIIKVIIKDIFALYARAFVGGDDIMKEMLFVIEAQNAAYIHYNISSYEEAKAKLSRDQVKHIENVAGEMVRRTAPNYNEAWAITRVWQRHVAPYFGPFTTFNFEDIRTTRNMIIQTVRQFKNQETDPGVRSRMKSDGIRRTISYASTTALSTSFGGYLIYGAIIGGVAAGRGLVGVLGQGWGPDDDDDNDEFYTSNPAGILKKHGYLRSMSGATLVFVDKTGYWVAVDPRILNIHGGTMNTIEGLAWIGYDVFTGDVDDMTKEKMKNVTGDFFNPYTDSNPAGKALVYALLDWDEYGRPIPRDSDVGLGTRFYEGIKGAGWSMGAPGTARTIVSSMKKEERLKSLEADEATLRSMLNKPGLKEKDREVLKARLETIKLSVDQAQRRIDMDDSYNSYLALGAIDVDPRTTFPEKFYKKLGDVKSINENLRKEIAANPEKSAELTDAKIEDYENDMMYLREWYTDMKRLVPAKDLDRILETGVTKAAESDQSTGRPLFSKDQLAYIRGKGGVYSIPKASLSVADYQKEKEKFR